MQRKQQLWLQPWFISIRKQQEGGDAECVCVISVCAIHLCAESPQQLSEVICSLLALIITEEGSRTRALASLSPFGCWLHLQPQSYRMLPLHQVLFGTSEMLRGDRIQHPAAEPHPAPGAAVPTRLLAQCRLPQDTALASLRSGFLLPVPWCAGLRAGRQRHARLRGGCSATVTPRGHPYPMAAPVMLHRGCGCAPHPCPQTGPCPWDLGSPLQVQGHQDVDDPADGDEQPKEEAEEDQGLGLSGCCVRLGHVPAAERSPGLAQGGKGRGEKRPPAPGAGFGAHGACTILTSWE